MHKVTDPQQGNTNRNATHTRNGACNSHAPPYHRYREKHSASKCRFKTEQCLVCGKIGYISRECCKRLQNTSRRHGHATHLVENQATEPELSPNNEYTLFPVKSQAATPPWQTVLTINGTQMEMEIDTGAFLFLISKATYV